MKLLKIAVYVILVIFIILSATLVTTTLIEKNSGKDVSIFGYRYMLVLSGSMDGEEQPYKIKTIRAHSLIAVKTVGNGFYETLKVGDVVTFRWSGPDGVTNLTHRVYEIQQADGVYYITTHGDANPPDSYEHFASTDGSAIGKVTFANYALGEFIKFLRTKLGMVLIVLVPCVLLMILEIVRIVNALNSMRNKKHKDSEIARLEKELEELKKK